MLEQTNVDPNHSDENDRTPLGNAAIRGHEGVVKSLLARGDVDFNCRDKDGDTPLRCAALCGHEGVVKLLLEREIFDPNLPEEDDRKSFETPYGRKEGGCVEAAPVFLVKKINPR